MFKFLLLLYKSLKRNRVFSPVGPARNSCQPFDDRAGHHLFRSNKPDGANGDANELWQPDDLFDSSNELQHDSVVRELA